MGDLSPPPKPLVGPGAGLPRTHTIATEGEAPPIPVSIPALVSISRRGTPLPLLPYGYVPGTGTVTPSAMARERDWQGEGLSEGWTERERD